MKFSNYHTHSHYCDGNGDLESYVKSAISLNMAGLGFSSHTPVPFNSFWNMPSDKLSTYLNEISTLKEKYKNDIDIHCSLEVDYVNGIIGPKSNQIQELKLDYIIGSVHYLGQFEDGSFWAIDGSAGEFKDGLEKIYSSDIKKVVKEFYKAQKEMIQNECPDVLGHFDKIKMHNKDSIYFNESDKWYKNEVLELLEIVSQKECIVEINTKTYLSKNELFPGKEWLEVIRKMNIPIVINSDSHYPKNLVDGFNQLILLLKEVGFEGQCVFRDAGWRFEKW